jgi:hypothetical protein
MWEPQPLTLLWAFTACYRDSFTFLPYTSTLKMEAMCSSETFNTLHDVISQKIELFSPIE